MTNIEAKCRQILNVPPTGELDYNEVVKNYGDLLYYYATSLSDEDFLNTEIYTYLNYSLHYCTGNVLHEYVDFDLDYENFNYKEIDNEHCKNILVGASLIVEKFNYFGLDNIASVLANAFYVIMDAIYKFENDLEYGSSKVYS